MIRFILIFSVVIYFTDALSCVPCGSAPCEVPKCCPSGKLTLDACGCCPVCAKGEKETCGGPWNTSGNCVVGLNCLKLCKCSATYKDRKGFRRERQCVFPFKFNGKTYNKCTTDETEDGQPWCAFRVDKNGEVIKGKWANCDPGCPGTEWECGEQDLFQQEGRCIVKKNAEPVLQRSRKPYAIDENYSEFNNITEVCPQRAPPRPGVKEISCECTKSLRPIEDRGEGENCTPNYAGPGWCFLDHIDDPENPSRNCYDDTYWSPSNGRFYSSLACEGASEGEGTSDPPRAPDYPGGPPEYPYYDDNVPPTEETTPDYVEIVDDSVAPPPPPPSIIEERIPNDLGGPPEYINYDDSITLPPEETPDFVFAPSSDSVPPPSPPQASPTITFEA